jgi:hypothetical protein
MLFLFGRKFYSLLDLCVAAQIAPSRNTRLRFCADENPSARIVDCARMKGHPRAIDDLV